MKRRMLNQNQSLPCYGWHCCLGTDNLTVKNCQFSIYNTGLLFALRIPVIYLTVKRWSVQRFLLLIMIHNALNLNRTLPRYQMNSIYVVEDSKKFIGWMNKNCDRKLVRMARWSWTIFFSWKWELILELITG